MSSMRAEPWTGTPPGGVGRRDILETSSNCGPPAARNPHDSWDFLLLATDPKPRLKSTSFEANARITFQQDTCSAVAMTSSVADRDQSYCVTKFINVVTPYV